MGASSVAALSGLTEPTGENSIRVTAAERGADDQAPVSCAMVRWCRPAANGPSRTRYSEGEAPRVRKRCCEYLPSSSSRSTADSCPGLLQSQPPHEATTLAMTSAPSLSSNASSLMRGFEAGPAQTGNEGRTDRKAARSPERVS